MRRGTCVPCTPCPVHHCGYSIKCAARPIEMSLRFAISISVVDEPATSSTTIPIANIVHHIQWKWIKASVPGTVRVCVCVREKVLSFIRLSKFARSYYVRRRTTFAARIPLTLRYYHFLSISFAPCETEIKPLGVFYSMRRRMRE